MTDYINLRKLAEAATPGPWRMWLSGAAFRVTTPAMDNHPLQAYVCKGSWWAGDSVERPGKNQAIQNGAYIAAASPKVVLALLDEIDAAAGAKCVGCHHAPSPPDMTYSEECLVCRRFYGDNFTKLDGGR